MKQLTVNLPERSYEIIIKRGVLDDLHKHIDLDRRVLIVTDDGVPPAYAEAVKQQAAHGFIHTVRQGESAKSFAVLEAIESDLLKHSFDRKDLVVAVGGGVVGDLAGFAAACYMRGIDFVNIPTTTLSQIDSSIGGKTAINLNGVKNIIGAFHQPKLVLIDLNTLNSLPVRHFYNGLVEAIKAGMIYDPALFELFESCTVKEYADRIEEIIHGALLVKKAVVEADEKEAGLRKILNFGHTLGHGYESACGLDRLLHGEAVAIGMLLILQDQKLKGRLQSIIEKLKIPTEPECDPEQVFELICHDKKAEGDRITIVQVPELGRAELETIELEQLKAYL